MANTKSAKKAVRSSGRKNKVNRILKSNFKKNRKEVLEAVAKKTKKGLDKKLSAAVKAIDKAAKKKTIHKKTAARYKSRLAKAVNKK